MNAEDKQKKALMIEQVFSTRSWTKVENMQSDKIKEGYETMLDFFNSQDKIEKEAIAE